MSLAVIVLGIISAVTRFPQNIVDSQFKKHLTLGLDSPEYDEWIEPPPPIYMQYYIFNVTNTAEILQGGKPNVVECGPYTYRMYIKRYDLEFYDNHTVSFYFNHTLVFQPKLSNGTENDTLFHLNMPLATIGVMLETTPIPPIAMDLFNRIITMIGEEDLVVAHTVEEILFGYVDPFFNLLSKLLGKLGIFYDPMFAPFYKFNNSNDGQYLMNTGKGNYCEASQIERWNGMDYLPFWSTPYANMVNGTDGSFFSPYVKRDQRRYLFFSDMCRSMALEYEYDSSVKGVDTLHFHFPDDLLANTTINPDNIGFCVTPEKCYDSGVINAASCREGAPALLSLPHLYNAAKVYQDGITGMHPNKTKHDSVFDVEPMSGVVFRSARRLQVNMEVHKSKYITQLKNVRNFTVFPVLWLAGVAEMDDHTAKLFRGIMVLVSFMNVVAYVTIAIGLLTLFIIGLILYRRKSEKYQKIVSHCD